MSNLTISRINGTDHTSTGITRSERIDHRSETGHGTLTQPQPNSNWEIDVTCIGDRLYVVDAVVPWIVDIEAGHCTCPAKAKTICAHKRVVARLITAGDIP